MAMALWQHFGVWWRYLGVNPNTRAQSDSQAFALFGVIALHHHHVLFYSRFPLHSFPQYHTLPFFWAFYLEFRATHDHRSSS